jgi:hypothetical protein
MQKRPMLLAPKAFVFPRQKREDFLRKFIAQNLSTVCMLNFIKIRTSFGTHGKYTKNCIEPNSVTFRYLDSKIRYSLGFSYLNAVL